MTFVLILLTVTYLLKSVGDKMGLTEYVIGVVERNVSLQLIPLMIFLLLGLLVVATGNSWGVYAVAAPIVIGVSIKLGINVNLAVGALISAGIWGANSCFFSDSRILTAASTESNMYRQAVTQLPYTLIAAGITAVLYLIAGFIL